MGTLLTATVVILAMTILALCILSFVVPSSQQEGYGQYQKETTVSNKNTEYPKELTVNGVRCIALNENALSCDWNNQGENNGK